MGMRRALIAIALCVIAGACGQSESTDGAASLDREWRLVQGSTPDGEVLILKDAPVLRISGASIEGRTQCNSHGGEVSIEGSRFDAHPGYITTAACLQQRLNEAGSRYLQALGEVDTYELDGEVLILRGKGTVLRYEKLVPPPPATLEETRWRLESLLQGAGGEGTASSTNGEGWLRFHTDGTFEGATGCRTIGGDWESDGGVLSVTKVEMSGECRGNGHVREQDRHFRDVLEGRAVYVLDGQTLTVTDEDGDLGLDLRAP